ncbi:DUF4167 domain-containing protein [Cognatishimia sp. MH4019]|uniref:DUF4167 domain-containing protein n=1 Tax=Cognatishimia sp. MH4019 TaxID=2854030 RepID=UPI001CD6D4E3|nr:DUF4167 domain-containing protein [Cognatishimia sp. MH4019]
MRSSKSRSRSKGNRNNNRQVGNVVNRVFDSSGPEGKVRGTPQQIIDKYNQLARDATLSNDRVAAENFQQHAEHYTRMLGEALREQEARREQQEREQAERQQQQRERDREREEQRKQRQQEEANKADPGSAPQPDLGDSNGGLVETPEAQIIAAEPQAEKPKRPRKPRKPKAPESDAPEAAE